MSTIVVATAILDFEGRMLLGRRVGSGLYGPPGGKLDEGETLKEGAARELKEESGLRVEPHNLVELGFCERLDKHQLIFWYWVAQYRGSPVNREPDKCDGWFFIRMPDDDQCIQGMRLFKAKLMGALRRASKMQVEAAP